MLSQLRERASRPRFPLWARFLVAAFVVVGSVSTATAASLIAFLDHVDFQPLPVTPKLPPADPTGPQNFLLIGSDKRPDVSGKGVPGLSDTTMLVRLDPNTDRITTLSLPRDLRVEIPGYGTAKLNEAYSQGGPKLTYETVRDLTGVEINHIVDVDFEGFARVVNSIGCVYIDVDRRYFHSNEQSAEQYEEINLQPGYQALCGYDALDYARYRHTDTDIVRAARQQEFLRELRAKLPLSDLISDRHELISSFTEHTRSDIDGTDQLLSMLRLVIDLRSAPVDQVHFEGTLGPSYVDATQGQIEKAVAEFMGAEPQAEAADAVPPSSPVDQPETPSTATHDRSPNLTSTSYGKELARGLAGRELPVFYPTELAPGSDYAQEPRAYKVNGTGEGSPPNGERAAYKWVFSAPGLGQYYGFEGTRWSDPPILDDPDEERTIGNREYELFYDGDRLRLVAWQTEDGSFWLSNTLTEELSNDQMIAIARGMAELPERGR